jgi:glycosyltransferase involved in cell wall biosynthesis
MLLIDAIYINNSGGKILLDYLIEEFEKRQLAVYYLLDERVRNNHPEIIKNKITYLEASLLNRHKFYKKNIANFSKVLCFGNLPPSLKLNAKVYTYFHQKIFLEIPKDIPLRQKVVFKIKTLLFKILRNNTDFWIVQTQAMKNNFLSETSKLNSDVVIIIPFYPTLKKSGGENRKNEVFVYVSSGSPHKNHLKLLEAFRNFYDSNKLGELHLTIGQEFKELNNLISMMIKEGYPIVNHGFVLRDTLGKIYGKAAFCIYPSLSESFGLGIIEAIENGCDIVGSDLPYTYAVCRPSLVFDPTKAESIAKAFQAAIEKHPQPTDQLVFNEIDTLINLLQDNENTK